MKRKILVLISILLLTSCTDEKIPPKSNFVTSITSTSEISVPISTTEITSATNETIFPEISVYEKKDTKVLYPLEIGPYFEYINNKGEIVSNSKFDSAEEFHDGMGKVSVNDGMYGFVNTDGRLAIDGIYYDAGNFSEGLAAVRNKNGLWGYINKDGEMIIDFMYECADEFNAGIAVVKKYDSNYASFINIKNQLIPSPPIDYWHARDINDGISIDDNYNYYNIREQKKINITCSFGDEKYFKIKDDFSEGFGILSIQKKYLSPELQSGDNGENEVFCYVNKKGNVVFGPFDKSFPFSEGLAIVEKNGETFCVNTEGKTVFKYQGLSDSFHDGLALFYKNGKIGFVDKTGKVIIPPMYDECRAFFNNGIAILEKEYCLYYIDKNNNVIYQCGDSTAHIPTP